MPRLTKRPWFGPRLLGWGWTPETWQGWLVAGLGLVGFVGVDQLTDEATSGTRLAWALGVVLLLTLICWATGTRPGGPDEWRQRHRAPRDQDEQLSQRRSHQDAPSLTKIAERMRARSDRSRPEL